MLEGKELTRAKAHARVEQPRESCGFVVDGIYVPAKNIHEDPENNFYLDPAEYNKAVITGKLQAVVHSHPGGPAWPSAADMKGQIASGVPWCILVEDYQPIWFGDGLPIPELKMRKFVHGVTDCYSACRDWYKVNRGVTLPEIPREWEWWKNDESLYEDNISAAGFEWISLNDGGLEPGDVLFAAIRSDKINHAAIFLGNNLIYHHMVGRLSCEEPISRWGKYFCKAARYVGNAER